MKSRKALSINRNLIFDKCGISEEKDDSVSKQCVKDSLKSKWPITIQKNVQSLLKKCKFKLPDVSLN